MQTGSSLPGGTCQLADQVLVLLAEDEPLVSLAAQDALEAGGFAVLTAVNGKAALAIVEDRFEELAGLITDIRLGGGPSGWEIAVRARELNPEIAVVYATADSGHEWSARGVPKSVVVQKPYASAQLVTAISTLLTEIDTGHA